jgi:hypothetical protein
MDEETRRAKLKELRQKRRDLVDASAADATGGAAGADKVPERIRQRLRQRRRQGADAVGWPAGEGLGAAGEFPLLRRLMMRRRRAAAGGAGDGVLAGEMTPERAQKLKERLEARRQKLDARLAKLEAMVAAEGGDANTPASPPADRDEAKP